MIRGRACVAAALIVLLSVWNGAAQAQAAAQASDEVAAQVMAEFTAARTAIETGRYPEAEAGFRRLHVRAIALWGERNGQTLIAASWVALAVVYQRRIAEAVALAQPVYDTALAAYGPDHDAVDRANLVLAVAAATSGRLDETVSRLQVGIARNRRSGDSDVAGALSMMLAEVYVGMGRRREADALRALAVLPDGIWGDLTRMRQRAMVNDSDGLLAAAQSLIDRPETPPALKVEAAAARGLALRRKATAGDRAALAQAEREARAALAWVPADDLLALASAKENLAATLLFDVSETPRSARVDEGVALRADVARLTEAALGPKHPSAVGRRTDYAMTLSFTERDDEAVTLLDALAAEADASPGLMTEERRAWMETTRASIFLRRRDGVAGYRRLRDAAQRFQRDALSPSRRDEALSLLQARSSIFRNQVLVAWVVIEGPRP